MWFPQPSTAVDSLQHKQSCCRCKACRRSIFIPWWGTQNDHNGVELSGQNRRINRRKFDIAELNEALAIPQSLQRRVFDSYRQLMTIRRRQQAFHPAAAQKVLDLPADGLIGLERAADDGDRLVVLGNLTDQPRVVDANVTDFRHDVLAKENLTAGRAYYDASLSSSLAKKG